MRQIDVVTFKFLIENCSCAIKTEAFFNTFIKVSNANIKVNTNDNYIIAHNELVELHINCIDKIYEDGNDYIVQKNNPIGTGFESYLITLN